MDKKAPQKEKRSVQWTRDLTTELIFLYKRHPCLYVAKNSEYRNETQRKTALEDIATSLGLSTLDNVTTDDVQRKIHGVRTQYSREIALMKKANLSGKPYKPKLWCFDMLDFLQNSTHNFKEENDLIEEFQEENKDYLYEEDVFETVEAPPNKRVKDGENVETTNVLFGKMLASEMESIQDEEILDELKQQILTALFKAKKTYRERRNS